MGGLKNCLLFKIKTNYEKKFVTLTAAVVVERRRRNGADHYDGNDDNACMERSNAWWGNHWVILPPIVNSQRTELDFFGSYSRVNAGRKIL